MEFHGKVIAILPARVGQSTRTGETWASQDFVLEADGQYIRRGKFSLWGMERIEAANLQLGEYVTAKFELEAHEYNGQWFNDTRCYDIEANGRSRIRGQQQRRIQQAPQQAPAPMTNQPMPQNPQYNPQPMYNQPVAQNQPYTQQPPVQYQPAAPSQGTYMTQEQIVQAQQMEPDPFRR